MPKKVGVKASNHPSIIRVSETVFHPLRFPMQREDTRTDRQRGKTITDIAVPNLICNSERPVCKDGNVIRVPDGTVPLLRAFKFRVGHRDFEFIGGA
jgi:hypothetical protein